MSDSDSDLVVANYYDVLGLSENATEDEIRTTYKRLTVAYHPDKNTNERSNEKFLEIKVNNDEDSLIN
jgi:molecular chaperone DnaJ